MVGARPGVRRGSGEFEDRLRTLLWIALEAFGGRRRVFHFLEFAGRQKQPREQQKEYDYGKYEYRFYAHFLPPMPINLK